MLQIIKKKLQARKDQETDIKYKLIGILKAIK